MKRTFSTKRLCRAGVIAALYMATTYAFMPFAFGPLQIRPAEALCILPLFFIEAVPALYVGCMLSNLVSPFAFYDVLFGSLATLLSALITYMVGVFIKKDANKLLLGGISPVLFNAAIIPLVILFLYPSNGQESATLTLYVSYAFSIALTQAVWVYGLGTPLFYGVKSLQRHGVSFLRN